jgi:hypothetical protein
MDKNAQAGKAGNRSDTIAAQTDTDALSNRQKLNVQMDPISRTERGDDIPAEQHLPCCNHDCNEGRNCPHRTAQGRTFSDHLNGAAVSAKHSLIQWVKRLNRSGFL